MSVPIGPETAEARDLHLQAQETNQSTPTLIDKPENTEKTVAADNTAVEKRPSQMSRLEELAAPTLTEKPRGTRFALIMVALYSAVFLTCLDISIVSPAIAPISNDFQDSSKAVWFFSVYLAINTAFQPFFAPWFKLTPKYTFLFAVLTFALGSLMCAVAQDSNTFIGGRAVAGLGSAGMYIGVMTIIALICEPHEAVIYSNGVGAVYSLGAVSGPLIGGAFTTHVTWRWCFYINLPITGVTLLACIFFLPDAPKTNFWLNFQKAFFGTDFIGLILVIGALIQLLIVFQWGGIRYDWNDSIIIGLLCGFSATVVVIGLWILFRGEKAYLRPRIVRKRVMWVGMLLNFGIAAAYFTIITILAFYFQIRGSSAIRSGVQLLALIGGVIAGLFIGGAVVPKIGYTNPVLILGNIVFCVAVGCFTLFDENSSTAEWAGLTFMAGVGSGFSFMLPFITVTAYFTAHSPGDMEAATTTILFPQTLGGSIIFGAGQTIFQNKYYRGILAIPGLENATEVAEGGITAFYDLAPPEFVEQIKKLAIDSIRYAYYPGLAVLAFTTIFFLPLFPWVSVKPPTKAETASNKVERVVPA